MLTGMRNMEEGKHHMAENINMNGPSGPLESFEVTKGGVSGDLLSTRCGKQSLKVGYFGCGYFEYWRMYKGLGDQVALDMQHVADRLGAKHDVFYPGFVDTLDKANQAGLMFKKEQIDVLVISEGTYCPDYFVHQALLHIPQETPLIIFASQVHKKFDFSCDYGQSLRNSGPMALVQLTGGFRKMGKFEKYEVVVGTIDEDEVYEEIDRIIQVHTAINNLKHSTIGTIGHVFRGMYDFNFDKTAVTGTFGPHVMDLQIDHLVDILDKVAEDDSRVTALCDKVHAEYNVVDLDAGDIVRGARLGVALQTLVDRYKLDGLVLLGQHFIEVKADTTCYLGLSEILSTDQAVAVSEGDTLGCIMSMVLKDFSGLSPFFGEWEEIDTSLNALMILGHGFIDPRVCRKDRPVNVKPACENWGFTGNAVGFEATYPPGVVTMTHAIQDPNGWRLLVSRGEILDTPPMSINESSLVIRVEQPVKQYLKDLMNFGFSHHCIAVPGDYVEHLECLGRQLDMEICRL
jgi:L-arabinose isomerase